MTPASVVDGRARGAASDPAPWLAVALHLTLGLVLYSSSGPDDVHITYGAAASLLRHGAVANYNGDRIEQSSSLAHVLLTALLSKITGISVVTVGHTIPVVAGAACLPLVYVLAKRLVPRAPGATTLFVACIPQSVDWTFGGLEGPLFALVTLLAVLSGAAFLARGGPKALLGLTFALTLAGLTRPEGMLVSGLAAVGLVATASLREHRKGALGLAALRPELGVLAASIVAAALTSAAHVAISGHVFPNPVLAKARGLALWDGIAYLWESTPWSWMWAVVACVAGVDGVAGRLDAPRDEGAAERLVALFAVAYIAFVATSGGDWMWGGRFLANEAPLFGILVVQGVLRVAPPSLSPPRLGAALVLACVPATLAIVGGTRTGRPLWVVPKMRQLVAARYPAADYTWSELASGVSLRDIPVSESLSDILARVAPLKATPLVVASRQSGFTIFHALERSHPAVRFVDLENLATSDFVPCGDPYLVRDTKGALLPMDVLVDPPADLVARCHPTRPDIVFGASHLGDVKALTGAGYTLVFRQRGRVGVDPWTVGHYSAFIAVDTGLARSAGLEPTLRDPLDFDWADASVLLLRRVP